MYHDSSHTVPLLSQERHVPRFLSHCSLVVSGATCTTIHLTLFPCCLRSDMYHRFLSHCSLVVSGATCTTIPLTLFPGCLRSDMYHMHNGQEKTTKTPDTQVTVRKCSPDFVQMWSGQKVCVEGFHPRMSLSADNPLPFLSGSTHLDVTTRSVDR